MRRIMTTALTLALAGGLAPAHDGRRYEVVLIDAQLAGRGYNSAGIDDGGGLVRPYYNALHDHWRNLGAGLGASTDLPGFDVVEPGPLVGHALTLTLVGGWKWVSPPAMPPAGTVPDLVPLGAGEEIYVSDALETVSTLAPGSFTLASNIGTGGALDLDLTYDILSEPSDMLCVLGFELSTDAPGVETSDTVYVILSPDGSTPAERLHHASLYLESYLGTPVCVADLAEPFGTLDFSDVLSFLGAFGAGDAAADLAQPFGVFDFSDVLGFLGAFGAGCP